MKFLAQTLILLCLYTACFAQKKPGSTLIEPGVSLQLATLRSQLISNIQYTLDFDIPENKSAKINGFVSLGFNLSAIPVILQLDFKQSAENVKRVTVNGKVTPIISKNEHIIIQKTFLKKAKNIIKIEFIAGNESLNRNDDYVYALFVPANARTAFPCFDQPDLKANFLLSLTVPKAWKVLANGTLQDSVRNDEKTLYRFSNSDKLPTYLFSFAAGKFNKMEQGIGKRKMELLYRETDNNKLKFSLDSIFIAHSNALNFLEDWTGIPYPFQKIGFASIPDFQFNGMEHPGTVLYKSSSLFLDEGATKDQFISRSNLISHETAHMWFGDLVTMKWFNDVWMKEVFANFMADKVTEQMMGKNTFELKFLQDHYPAAYGVDRTLGANPIRQHLNNLENAGSMYGNIIYHKAPIMMRQLEGLMGEENFQNGIREYLNRYANKNATWPNLIAILSKHTSADLNTWNTVWVNQPGRPIFTYAVQYNGNTIKNMTITQRPEQGEQRVWPQVFTLKLVYPNSSKIIKVNSTRGTLDLKEVIGLPKPNYYLFNADGAGYGLFPIDNDILKNILNITDPLERASIYINLYENTLAGKNLKPLEALKLFADILDFEQNEMNLKVIVGYITSLYWGFIHPQERLNLSTKLETTVWNAMERKQIAGNKKILFTVFQNVYLSSSSSTVIQSIWEKQQPPQGVKLSEDDYIALSLSIALRSDTATTVLQQQLERTANVDRKNRLSFLMPALSYNSIDRERFFYSLRDLKNRKKEAWVTVGLSYLNHPLRQKSSQKYLSESLNLLTEIQKTGDIFFPQTWLSATFGNYQTKEAYQIVVDFIKAHPNYNPMLKDKILQATDNLRRAKDLVK